MRGLYGISVNSTELSILTLHGHSQQDVTQPDEEVLGLGNYLLITPESMTRTH